MSLKSLVNQMVAHTNAELTLYYKKIKKQKLSVQQVMTLASLVEREGVSRLIDVKFLVSFSIESIKGCHFSLTWLSNMPLGIINSIFLPRIFNPIHLL